MDSHASAFCENGTASVKTQTSNIRFCLDDDYYDHRMDNRAHRTPSPGHPLQHGYQLEDNPYSRPPPPPGGLDIPMGPGRYSPGDSLQMQTAVSATRGSPQGQDEQADHPDHSVQWKT